MGIENEDLGQEENIDLVALANAGDKGGEEELPQLSATEQKAFDQGWRPQEDFEGPDDNWKSAKEYVRDGEFLATIKGLNQRMDDQKKDFDSRLENTNKLHEHRRLKEISDLKSLQREAVDDRDGEAFDKAQGQIDELEKAPEVIKPVVNTDPTIAAWEAKNPWINDDADDRAPVAQGIWNAYLVKNPNASPQQALTHVDDRMGKLFPTENVNHRRNQQNTNETPARRSKKAGKTLTMGDLTQNEKNEWAQFGQAMFKNEADFLKAVKDTRAA